MASTLSQLYRQSETSNIATVGTATPFRSGSATTRHAMSFIQSFTGVCYGVDVRFASNIGSPTGNVWVEMRSVGATPETGTLLATSNSISVASIVADVYSFTFASPPTNIAGTTVYLVLNSDMEISNTNYMQLVWTAAASYANGTWWIYNGSSWAAQSLDLVFAVYTDFKKWSVCYVNGNNSNDGKGWKKASFTSGGTYVPNIGDVITGATSNATATIQEIIVTSGAFTSANVAGSIYIYDNASGPFTSGENINIGTNLDVMTITNDFVYSCFKDVVGCTTAKGVIAGDHQCLAKSPDPYNTGISATVVNQSANITLSAPLTKTINNLNTLRWTPVGAGVTEALYAGLTKVGVSCSKIDVPIAFTTGKIGYFDLGSNQDYSSYSAISFWLGATTTLVLSTAGISIKLCSDVAGDIPVDANHVFSLTNIGTTLAPANGGFVIAKINKTAGGNISNAVRSVGIYVDSDLSTTGIVGIVISNLIACNSLSLQSLIKIGAPRNRWTPSTTLSIDDERVCTQFQPIFSAFGANSFLYYKVTTPGTTGPNEPDWPTAIGETVTDGSCIFTCMGEDECWWPIQSIDGTALRLDYGGTNTLPTFAQQGYYGRTNGQYALWARETTKINPVAGAASTIFGFNEANRAIDDLSTIGRTYGGVNTSTGLVDGETYYDAQNGLGGMFVDSATLGVRVAVENIGTVRCNIGFQHYHGAYGCRYRLLDGISNVAATMYNNTVGTGLRNSEVFGIRGVSNGSGNMFVRMGQGSRGKGWVMINCNYFGLYTSDHADYIKGIYVRNSYSGGMFVATGAYRNRATPYKDVYCTNSRTGTLGFTFNTTDESYTFERLLITDSLEVGGWASTNSVDTVLMSKDHDQITDNHQMIWLYGKAQYIYDGSYKHGNSTGAWRINPTNVARNLGFPIRMMPDNFLIRCQANVPVTVSLWYYKDHANINGKIYIPAHQLKGMTDTITSSITSVVGAWTKISATFTPTETGIAQWQWHTWDGVTTDKNLYISDFSQSFA